MHTCYRQELLHQHQGAVLCGGSTTLQTAVRSSPELSGKLQNLSGLPLSWYQAILNRGIQTDLSVISSTQRTTRILRGVFELPPVAAVLPLGDVLCRLDLEHLLRRATSILWLDHSWGVGGILHDV
jgi:hypothetical protein